MVAEAPAHPSTKVPMVLEAPGHPSHQGSDGVRGSHTSEPPRCWRLLLQKGRDREDSFIVGYPDSTLGLGRDREDSFIVGYRTCNDIRILPLVLGRDSDIPGCLAGMDRRSTAGNLTSGGGAPTSGHAMGVGIALDNPCSLNVSSPLKS